MFGKLVEILGARLNTLTSSMVEKTDKFDKRFDEVATHLAYIQAIVSKTNTSSKSIDIPLNRFNKFLDKLTPSDGFIVNREAYKRIICSIVPLEVLRTARDKHLAKHGVLFRFEPPYKFFCVERTRKETRKQFREGIGGRHSLFKKNVVLNFICNVQVNSFGMFVEEQDGTCSSREGDRVGGRNQHETAADADLQYSENAQPPDKNPSATPGLAVTYPKLHQPDWSKRVFILEVDVEHTRLVQDYSMAEASRRDRRDAASDSDSGENDDGDYTPGPGYMHRRKQL